MSAVSRHHAARPRSFDPGEGTAGRITAMIDPAFLVEMSWDAERLVLAPPDGHPLVVRPVVPG